MRRRAYINEARKEEDTGVVRRTIASKGELSCLALCPPLDLLAVGRRDCQVDIYTFSKAKLKYQLKDHVGASTSGDRRFSDHRPGFGSTARQGGFFPRIFRDFSVFSGIFRDSSVYFVFFRYSPGFFGKGSARGGNPGPRAPPGI